MSVNTFYLPFPSDVLPSISRSMSFQGPSVTVTTTVLRVDPTVENNSAAVSTLFGTGDAAVISFAALQSRATLEQPEDGQKEYAGSEGRTAYRIHHSSSSMISNVCWQIRILLNEHVRILNKLNK